MNTITDKYVMTIDDGIVVNHYLAIFKQTNLNDGGWESEFRMYSVYGDEPDSTSPDGHWVGEPIDHVVENGSGWDYKDMDILMRNAIDAWDDYDVTYERYAPAEWEFDGSSMQHAA